LQPSQQADVEMRQQRSLDQILRNLETYKPTPRPPDVDKKLDALLRETDEFLKKLREQSRI
jgi:VanZ family protein